MLKSGFVSNDAQHDTHFLLATAVLLYWVLWQHFDTILDH